MNGSVTPATCTPSPEPQAACSVWVNRPDRALATENKGLQLQVAHRCGLHFRPR